jgi:hypothetical protein
LIGRTPSSPVHFVPSAPDVAIRMLLLRRQQELEAVRLVAPLYAERYQQQAGRPTRDLVEVVVGREAMIQRVDQLWMAAQTELLQFDKPPYIMDPTKPNDYPSPRR